jgi:hypothetical protein
MEVRDESAMREGEEAIMERAVEAAIKPPASPELVSPAPAPAVKRENTDEGETITVSPCGMWVHYVSQVVVVQSADLPADLLAGWEEICPPNWSLAGRLRRIKPWQPTPSSIATQRRIDAGFALMIAMQWFLLGSFSMVRNTSWRRWWREPGSFITVFTIPAALFALIYPNNEVSRLLALPAMMAWFWWLGLLVWRILSFAWRLAMMRPVAAG